MTVPYTKPFLSIDQQVELLKSRGMAIPDETSAKSALASLGYYNLSGYWYPLRVIDPAAAEPSRLSDFLPGVSFDHAMALYSFDKSLRSCLLDRIELIEQALKVAIALEIGQLHKNAHRGAGFFERSFTVPNPGETESRHQMWLTKLDTEVQDRGTQWDFIRHFVAKYDPPIPIWVSIEIWEFGQAVRLFGGLKRHHQDNISNRFGVARSATFRSWLKSINMVRNICSHHERVWNRAITLSPAQLGHPFFTGTSTLPETWNRSYGTALMLRFLDDYVDPASQWKARFRSLLGTFPTAPGASLSGMGVPPSWATESVWL